MPSRVADGRIVSGRSEAGRVVRWRERAVGRSLSSATARSQDRAGRFVAAARDLVRESGDLDFAVQDVVQRAGLSLRAFYQHFDGKDDLVVALYEEVVHAAAERARRQVEKQSDPVERLRLLVFRLHGERGAFPASMASEIQQLARARPEEMRAALEPLVALFEEVVGAAQAAGAIRSGDPREHALHVVLVLLMHVQARGQGLFGGTWPTPSRDQVWEYCERALRSGPLS
jgi:AcrR family transcriptional regulator